MRNFRKIAVRVMAVLLTACLFEGAVRFCFEDWNEFTRVSKLERGELKGTLDTVYIGTSLTYHAIRPDIMDEALGTNSFNLATAAQPLMGTYYLIREAADENPLKKVYLGIIMGSVKQERLDIRYVSAYENLRTWKWKLRYLLSLRRENVINTSLLYSTRVETYTQFQMIKRNILNKFSGKTSSRYGMRGYRHGNGSYDGAHAGKKNDRINFWNAKKGLDQTQEESMEYLEKIAQFCRDEGIELTLLVLPVTQDYIDGAGDMDAWDGFCREFAEKWDAQFYNFMLYKDRVSEFTNDKFNDEKHLNDAGGELFSHLLAQIEQSGRPEDYFYSSMSEF